MERWVGLDAERQAIGLPERARRSGRYDIEDLRFASASPTAD